jgi:alpha-beta hydrolase superfamily lysophospholipase
VHGIQSHGGWYEYSCRRLSEAGYAVYFLDRRGAGLNEHDRGDAPSFRRLIDDIADFIERVARPEHGCEGRGQSPEASHALRIHAQGVPPKIPVVLLAISWGGKLAAGLCRRHPGKVDGVALLCPGFFPKVRPTLGQRLGILISRLVRPHRLFPVPLSDPSLFTATPRWQEFIAKDPLAVRYATARLLAESVRLDMYLRWLPLAIKVPMLLMLAGEDRIIDNAKTRAFVDRIAVGDKHIIDYPHAHHTLEFEPDPDPFIADLLAWLREHW